jgi:hypothetical protein
MKCLCSGPYPSIERQVSALRAESDAPRLPMRDYLAIVEAVNEHPVMICVEQFRRGHEDRH